MKQAILKPPKEKVGNIKTFEGVTGKEKLNSGFLEKAMNLSSRFYPYLATRLPREEVGKLPGTGKVNGILREQAAENTLSNLTFVRGTDFYYKGNLISPNAVLGKSLTDGEKLLIDFDGKIFIFPDRLYYDYTGASGEGLKKMENQIWLDFSIAGGRVDQDQMIFIVNCNLLDDSQVETYRKQFMEMKLGDWLIIRNSGDVAGVKTMKSVEEQEWRYALDTDWTKAEIAQISETSMSVSIRMNMERKDGTPVTFTIPDSGTLFMKRHIPMTGCAMSANNRLWCAEGTRLYVSAEGSPMNFNRFENLEADSFSKNLADRGGKIVAFATLNGKVVVLKESTMYQIYGSDATEFYIPYTIDKGCIDRNSVVNMDNKLYFLAEDGVFTFDGNKVKNTGLERRFQKGFAQTDGVRYYLMAQNESGESELWVYDAQSEQWYTEEGGDFAYFIRIGADVCAVRTDGSILRFGTGAERFSWEMVTKPITADTNSPKRPGELFLRLKGARNTSAQVWIRTNREPEYRLVANLLFDGKNTRDGHIFRLGEEVEGITVPLGALPCDNFTVKIRGKGELILYEAEHRSYLS